MGDNLSEDIIRSMMKDPIKRKALMQLLGQQKPAPEPQKKLEKSRFESPTMLHRRRALVQDQNLISSGSSSSDIAPVSGPKLPFSELLKGVRAYVEVRRNGEDRSDKIKTMMGLMGATVKDSFTNDVTHVIYKDGTFTTYQKAKLLNVHLVSILWLEAVRKNSTRIKEKLYPAFGSKVNNENVSLICSQLSKDFRDVVRDEKLRNKSENHAPSPSTSDSRNSYITADNDEILNLSDVTSDDSDCCNNTNANHKPKDLDLTASNPISDSLTSDRGSSASQSLIQPNRRNLTINSVSDMDITPNTSSNSRILRRSCRGSNKALQATNSDRTVSGLDRLSGPRILSEDSDRTKSGLDERSKRSTSSSIQIIEDSDRNRNLSKSNKENHTGTTMSSLRLSEQSHKNSTRNGTPSPGKRKKGANQSVEAKETNNNTPNSKGTVSPKKRKKVAKEIVEEETNHDLDQSLSKEVMKARLSIAKTLFQEPDSSEDGEAITPRTRRASSVTPRKSPTGPVNRRASSTTGRKTRRLYNPHAPPSFQDLDNGDETSQPVFKNPNDLNLNGRRNRGMKSTPVRRSRRVSVMPEAREPEEDLPITSLKRRSTLDFVPATQKSSEKRKAPKTSIVCTKMHRPQVLEFEATVKQLGRFFVENAVTYKTSHLVAAEPKRTLNMLKAMARGCWIVSQDWLLQSNEAGRWLNEEDFEVTEFSPHVQKSRVQRQAFGPKYSMEVFNDCGDIYVDISTTPSCLDLKELIRLCGGQIVLSSTNANVIVGTRIRRSKGVCVAETWVLDSIMVNSPQDFNKYLLIDPGTNSPVF